MLPLTLLGLGAASVKAYANGRALLSDDASLGRLGLSENDRKAIMDAAQRGDTDTAQHLLQEGFKKRDPSIAAEFQGKMDQETEKLNSDNNPSPSTFHDKSTQTPFANSHSELANKAHASIISRENRDSGRNSEAALIAAEDLLRAGPEASFGESQSGTRLQQLSKEKELLRRASTGKLSVPGKFIADEGEHFVHFDENENKALKQTNNQSYGYVLDQAGPGLKLEPRPATPSEYLWRLGLQNAVFGDSIQVTGVGTDSYGTPTIHTSQPWVSGDPASMGDVRSFMESKGFMQLPRQMLAPGVPSVLAWYRPSDHILAYDAKPSNFVRQGDTIDPIDLIVTQYPEKLLEETAHLNGVDWASYKNTGMPPSSK